MKEDETWRLTARRSLTRRSIDYEKPPDISQVLHHIDHLTLER